MKRTLLALLVFLLAGDLYATEEAVRFGRFGTITVYRESPRPRHVVLFRLGRRRLESRCYRHGQTAGSS